MLKTTGRCTELLIFFTQTHINLLIRGETHYVNKSLPRASSYTSLYILFSLKTYFVAAHVFAKFMNKSHLWYCQKVFFIPKVFFYGRKICEENAEGHGPSHKNHKK